jgi:hypothetical protein
MNADRDADLRRAGTRERALAIASVLTDDRDRAQLVFEPFLRDARFVSDLLDVVFRDHYWRNDHRKLVPRHPWLEAAWLVGGQAREEMTPTSHCYRLSRPFRARVHAAGDTCGP